MIKNGLEPTQQAERKNVTQFCVWLGTLVGKCEQKSDFVNWNCAG